MLYIILLINYFYHILLLLLLHRATQVITHRLTSEHTLIAYTLMTC